MADQEPKIQFEVDIGNVLVKLHLGGVSTGKGANVLFFNSGIVKDDPKASPESPNPSTKFDMSNKSGKYEVGVSFTKPLEIEKKFSEEDKAKAAEEANNKSNSKKPIDTPADDAEDHAPPLSPEAEEAIEEIDAKNQKAAEASEVDYRKRAFTFLKAYMEAFAGKDAASKIKDADMVKTILPEKMNTPDKMKYKDFKIPSADKSELDKIAEEQNKNKTLKKIEVKNICYKIGYTLDVKSK